ncbi:restriction endonuclease subunit S [Streptomyces albidoflavus]
MKLTEYRVGEIMRLVRRPVDVCAEELFHEIGLRSFGNGVFHKPPVSGEELGAKKVFHIKPGDLIFSNVFAWEGAVALASEHESGKIGSHRFMTYKVDAQKADSRYLLYYFYGGPGLQSIREASPGSAGRNRTLGIKNFERQIVRLPDLDEQRRIADKIDGVMSRLTQFNTMREYSGKLAHQYMDSLLRPIEDQVPLSVALRPISDFVDVDPDGNYRTAGILNRGRGLFHRPIISGGDTKYPRYNRLHTGQFVYSKLFGWEGSLAVVPAEFEGVHVSHEFPTFDIDPSVADVEYMSHLARWPRLHDALKDKGTGMGSRRQRVNVDRLLATRVPLPSLAEQRRVARQLSMVRQTTEAGAEQLAQVAALRPALLNAAFSGQL